VEERKREDRRRAIEERRRAREERRKIIGSADISASIF
jgi:hypothetical protein